MAQTKILVDSTCYFRLAQNIHPLLGVPFGEAGFTLYAHAALVSEFQKEPRFRTKFDWFLRGEFVDNRRFALQIGRKQSAAIQHTFEFMWETARAEALGVSRVDVQILATAAELEIRVATDDQDLLKLAELFGVHAMTSLEVLRLMLDEKHIDAAKIEQVVAQWQYDRDVPANFRSQYVTLFGSPPPKE